MNNLYATKIRYEGVLPDVPPKAVFERHLGLERFPDIFLQRHRKFKGCIHIVHITAAHAGLVIVDLKDNLVLNIFMCNLINFSLSEIFINNNEWLSASRENLASEELLSIMSSDIYCSHLP